MAPSNPRNRNLRLRRVQWHDLDGQVVILDSNALALNPTAALLWRRLVEGADRSRLVEMLTTEYGIEEVIASHDVDNFLDGLKDRGLLAEAV